MLNESDRRAMPRVERASHTISLLEYYANLSMHHRVMMIGFVTAYLGITQFLLLTPLDSLKQAITKSPNAFIASVALLSTFVLAACLHHACHFCSTAGLRALMAAETHFHYLPLDEKDVDPVYRWLSGTARNLRQVAAVTSYSVAVLALLFGTLVCVNTMIFIENAKEFFKPAHFDRVFLFGGFLLVQAGILFRYSRTFLAHYRYLVRARDELAVVLKSTTRAEVASEIDKLSGKAPKSSMLAEMILFEKTRPPE